MKINKYLLLLLVLGLMLTIAACYKINTSEVDVNKVYIQGDEIPAVTEADLVLNPTERIEFGAVVALYLEHFAAPNAGSYPDTDTIGIDRILYTTEDTISLTFRPDDAGSYNLRLYRTDNNALVFDAANYTKPFVKKLAPGNYDMVIGSQQPHGTDTLGFQWVFIQPDREQLPDTGNIKSTSKYKTIYWYLTSRRNACFRCDMTDIDLSDLKFIGVDFEGSTLNHAELSNSDFTNARLNSIAAKEVNLFESNLHGADLSYTNLTGSNIMNANFEFGILIETNLSDCIAYGANFCYTTRSGWILTGIEADTSTLCFP